MKKLHMILIHISKSVSLPKCPTTATSSNFTPTNRYAPQHISSLIKSLVHQNIHFLLYSLSFNYHKGTAQISAL